MSKEAQSSNDVPTPIVLEEANDAIFVVPAIVSVDMNE